MPAATNRRVFLLAAAAVLLAAPAMAQTQDEITAAQSAIAGQMEAFLADDGAAAYSYAAPKSKKP